MEKISVMAMLVVAECIRVIHMDCFDGRVLRTELRKVCCQTVPAVLSETARLRSSGDKWLIHFRLHV